MDLIPIACQVVIALGIFNVWMLRFGKTTSWRGGTAKDLSEELTVYVR